MALESRQVLARGRSILRMTCNEIGYGATGVQASRNEQRPERSAKPRMCRIRAFLKCLKYRGGPAGILGTTEVGTAASNNTGGIDSRPLKIRHIVSVSLSSPHFVHVPIRRLSGAVPVPLVCPRCTEIGRTWPETDATLAPDSGCVCPMLAGLNPNWARQIWANGPKLSSYWSRLGCCPSCRCPGCAIALEGRCIQRGARQKGTLQFPPVLGCTVPRCRPRTRTHPLPRPAPSAARFDMGVAQWHRGHALNLSGGALSAGEGLWCGEISSHGLSELLLQGCAAGSVHHRLRVRPGGRSDIAPKMAELAPESVNKSTSSGPMSGNLGRSCLDGRCLDECLPTPAQIRPIPGRLRPTLAEVGAEFRRKSGPNRAGKRLAKLVDVGQNLLELAKLAKHGVIEETWSTWQTMGKEIANFCQVGPMSSH